MEQLCFSETTSTDIFRGINLTKRKGKPPTCIPCRFCLFNPALLLLQQQLFYSSTVTTFLLRLMFSRPSNSTKSTQLHVYKGEMGTPDSQCQPARTFRRFAVVTCSGPSLAFVCPIRLVQTGGRSAHPFDDGPPWPVGFLPLCSSAGGRSSPTASFSCPPPPPTPRTRRAGKRPRAGRWG